MRNDKHAKCRRRKVALKNRIKQLEKWRGLRVVDNQHERLVSRKIRRAKRDIQVLEERTRLCP